MLNYIAYKNTHLFIAREVALALGYKNEKSNISYSLTIHCPDSLSASEYGVKPEGARMNSRLLTTEEVVHLATHSQYDSVELMSWLKNEGLMDATIITHSRRDEMLALSVIEQLLGITLHKQYQVGPYRIDGYDPDTNVAYEIDEPFHSGQREVDEERQAYITSVLGCSFKRIKV